MAIIPDFFMNAVVALGIDQPNGEKLWIGTGFIVGRKDTDNPKIVTCYLITNKHVVNDTAKVYARFNSLGSDLVKDYDISLRNNKGEKLYSEHPDVLADVIAIQIAPQVLINDKSIFGYIDLDDHALTLQQMQDTGVNEGSLVYSLGFPMNLVSEIKAPICRLGCISRITDAFLIKDKCIPFLVDAQVFPGNSGGPIISRPEYVSIAGTPCNSGANLIGILSAYIPYKTTLINAQTGEPTMIQQENSGLTVVHPVDRIKETVELEWQRMSART